MDKIILHIGTEKTGSTSIQHALAHDRAKLRKSGILYPALFGSENHMEIAVYAMEDGVNDELRQHELSKAGCDLPEYRKRLKESLTQQIVEASCHTLILSNEHCHSRLNGSASVERLKELLLYFASEIEVVVYLRRQDYLAVSLHSTRLKLGGGGEIFPLSIQNILPLYFDFNMLLERYASVFGAGNVRVRLFEPEQLHQGDVVADFYSVASLMMQPPVLARANESISAKQWMFLERFNEIFPIMSSGVLNRQRGPIYKAISDACIGPAFLPNRSDAIEFYERFIDGNESVRRNFFPNLQRQTLFDESFQKYPEHSGDEFLTVEDMFEFVSSIWRFRQANGGK